MPCWESPPGAGRRPAAAALGESRSSSLTVSAARRSRRSGAWRRLQGVWLGLALGLVLLAGSPAAAALDAEERAAVGEAFRAAERGDWRRAFA